MTTSFRRSNRYQCFDKLFVLSTAFRGHHRYFARARVFVVVLPVFEYSKSDSNLYTHTIMVCITGHHIIVLSYIHAFVTFIECRLSLPFKLH